MSSQSLPIWATAARIEELFTLSKYHVQKLAGNGTIRSAKLDKSKKRSGRLYNVTDIVAYLEEQTNA